MKKAGNWLAVAFRPSLLFFGAGAFVVLLLWFQLGSLVPGFSETELTAQGESATWRAVLDNPLFLPHKLLQLSAQYFGHHGPLAMRSASALFGLLAIGSFYYVLHNWYSRRVAVLGTFLFATSSWLLHSARLGTPSISYTLLFAVMACAVWLQKSRAMLPAVLLGSGLVLVLLYIPGMLWFVIPGLLWQAPRLIRFLSRQHPAVLVLLTLGLVGALAPLGLAFYHDPGLIRIYLGLPEVFPAPLQLAKSILYVPGHIFVQGTGDPLLGVGDLALLDWSGSVLFLVGLTSFFANRRLDRVVAVVYAGAAGMILVGLGGAVAIGLLLPFVYLMIASGLTLLLQQWFTVFPANPVARTIGATLMTIAVLLSSYYHINRYFIAWPHAPDTKAAFHLAPESSTIEPH